MAKFKVGDRVEFIENYGTKKIGDQFTVSKVVPDGMHVLVYGYKDMFSAVYEYRLKLVETKAKRVKVTVEGDVKDGIVQIGGIGISLSSLITSPDVYVEDLPDPIVLPTKRSAVIRILESRYVRTTNEYFPWEEISSGNTHSDSQIKIYAEKYGMTVLFEGE